MKKTVCTINQNQGGHCVEDLKPHESDVVFVASQFKLFG